MSEPKQDPANTQMFRAFVERGEQAPGRRLLLPVVLAVAAVVILAVVLVLTLG